MGCIDLKNSVSLLFSLCREFNTSVDIKMHKWADSLQFAELCAQVCFANVCFALHVFSGSDALTPAC